MYMSNYLIEEYSNMIKEIDKSNIKIRKDDKKKLCMQFYSKGNNFDGNLMVVGRAVNGWDEEFHWIHGNYASSSPLDLVTKAYEKSLSDPLQWVMNFWRLNKEVNGKRVYNTAKSSFWQLSRNVLKNITSDEWKEDIWSTKLIWSNLYKIAPAIGGNPNNTLCKYQLEYCKRILEYEIDINRPQYILFVTGYNWYKDFEDCIPISNEYAPKIYVSERPEFRNINQMTEEIIRNFKI